MTNMNPVCSKIFKWIWTTDIRYYVSLECCLNFSRCKSFQKLVYTYTVSAAIWRKYTNRKFCLYFILQMYSNSVILDSHVTHHHFNELV